MQYLNMRYRDAMLGDIVKTSMHPAALRYMIKRLDTLQESVYLVPMDGSFSGQWVSANALFLDTNKGN